MQPPSTTPRAAQHWPGGLRLPLYSRLILMRFSLHTSAPENLGCCTPVPPSCGARLPSLARRPRPLHAPTPLAGWSSPLGPAPPANLSQAQALAVYRLPAAGATAQVHSCACCSTTVRQPSAPVHGGRPAVFLRRHACRPVTPGLQTTISVHQTVERGERGNKRLGHSKQAVRRPQPSTAQKRPEHAYTRGGLSGAGWQLTGAAACCSLQTGRGCTPLLKQRHSRGVCAPNVFWGHCWSHSHPSPNATAQGCSLLWGWCPWGRLGFAAGDHT